MRKTRRNRETKDTEKFHKEPVYKPLRGAQKSSGTCYNWCWKIGNEEAHYQFQQWYMRTQVMKNKGKGQSEPYGTGAKITSEPHDGSQRN